MSCNGACIIIPSQTYGSTKAPPGRGMYAGDRAPRYEAPSYFSDPNAITALEFEQLREPMYRRSASVDDALPVKMYSSKDGSYMKVPNRQTYGVFGQVPQVTADVRHDQISNLEQNVAYFASLQTTSLAGRMIDYSIMATNRIAWERMKELMTGGMRVVPASHSPNASGPAMVYTNLMDAIYDDAIRADMRTDVREGGPRNVYAGGKVPDAPGQAVQPNSEIVARKRNLLEDLIKKEKEALTQ